MTLADVNLWGRRIAAVRVDAPGAPAAFEYDPAFLDSSIEPSPLRMPKRPGVFSFPGLSKDTFEGLPGLIWDSLPDRFGQSLIERYYRANGRRPETLNAVEKLCYVGSRGMGALEFTPAVDRPKSESPLDVERLREFAQIALEDDSHWAVDIDTSEGMAELLEVGTSAGGARPKAVIAWNPTTNEVRSGRVDQDAGFEPWLLKFDGVGNERREVGRSTGYGAIEYAYSILASRAGLTMSECRLYEEGGRRHFMTRRFDRAPDGRKLHMQTLAALAHIDFNIPARGSYEDAFDALRAVGAPGEDIEQQFRRMVFNVVFRNQDDHPKNIALLMNMAGEWRLSPAYDVSFAFNPTGEFTSRHQMSLNGKLDGFDAGDFEAVSRYAGLVAGRWRSIVEQVVDAAAEWPKVARETDIPERRIAEIDAQLRTSF